MPHAFAHRFLSRNRRRGKAELPRCTSRLRTAKKVVVKTVLITLVMSEIPVRGRFVACFSPNGGRSIAVDSFLTVFASFAYARASDWCRSCICTDEALGPRGKQRGCSSRELATQGDPAGRGRVAGRPAALHGGDPVPGGPGTPSSDHRCGSGRGRDLRSVHRGSGVSDSSPDGRTAGEGRPDQ